MKDTGRKFLFFFYLISGIVVGSLIAGLAQNVSWLSWLAFGTQIGFGYPNPALLDLSVLSISFGFSFSITVAHIISIGIAMAIYYKIRR